MHIKNLIVKNIVGEKFIFLSFVIFLDDSFKDKAVFIEKPTILEYCVQGISESDGLKKSYMEGKLADETASKLLEIAERIC